MAQSRGFVYHFKSTLFLGLPLIGMNLTQSGIHLIDTLMLGWYGVPELAASVLGSSFFFVLFIMGSGFAQAVTPLVATSFAEDDRVKIRRVTRMGIWLSVLYGVFTIPIMFFSGAILQLLGQEPTLSNMAENYLRFVCISIFPALIIMVLRSYLSALDRAQIILGIAFLSLLLNTGLNWILIFGNLGIPEMGLIGAAIASAITQIITVLIFILYITRHTYLRQYQILKRLYRIDWDIFGTVFNLGWPIGFTMLAEVGLFAGTAIIFGLIGTIPLAAHGIALQVVSLSFMFHLGLSQATTVRVGYYIGKHDFDNLKQLVTIALLLSLFVVLMTMLVFLVLPDSILGLFISPDDSAKDAIIAVGVSLLFIASIFQIFDAGQVMMLGALRGFQDTKIPMLIAAFGYWLVGLPICYYLGVYLNYGGVGVWVGLVLGLAIVCILLIVRLTFVYQKKFNQSVI